MAFVVVDTDVASKLFKDQLPASWLDRLGKQDLAVSFVTIAEAVYGAQRKPINDAWIAATCVTMGYPLATLNRKHFEPLASFGLDLL